MVENDKHINDPSDDDIHHEFEDTEIVLPVVVENLATLSPPQLPAPLNSKIHSVTSKILNLSSDKVSLETKAPKAINQKQRDFVEYIVTELMSPSDAYKKAYKVSNLATCKTNAYRLLRKPEVKSYLESTELELRALSHIPKHYILIKLRAFIGKCEREDDKKYFIEGINTINRMMGYNIADKGVTTQTNIQQTISFGDWVPDAGKILPVTEAPIVIPEAPKDILET